MYKLNFNQEYKLYEIILEYIPPELYSTLNEDSDFNETLVVDNLDLVSILLDSEKEFDISIPDKDSETIKTVKDLKLIIERLLDEKLKK